MPWHRGDVDGGSVGVIGREGGGKTGEDTGDYAGDLIQGFDNLVNYNSSPLAYYLGFMAPAPDHEYASEALRKVRNRERERDNF